MSRIIITNRTIADILAEIGLILLSENISFKPQAYAAAADSIRAMDKELADLYKTCGKKCLKNIPGIGESISEKIEELIKTGRLKSFEKLKQKYPLDILELTRLPNVGPKTAVTLYQRLGIRDLSDLERALRTNKIASIKGFGEKTQENLRQGFLFLKQTKGRMLLHEALPLAERLVQKMRGVPGVLHFDVAGSIRRRKETIGDLDFVAATSNPKTAAIAFTSLPEVERVLDQGSTFITVRMKTGVNGDLRIVEPKEYGSALLHFTGSKEHNIILRERAIKRGWKLSEYGLIKGTRVLASKTEKDVYSRLGLAMIPAELREARGEIEASEKDELPKLISYDDIKGDLQVQTSWSDGFSNTEDMARAAKATGLSYIAVTDHTKSLIIANGLDEQRLKKQASEIDALNKRLHDFHILKSTECDILKDGSLDLPDIALKKLDLVGISIHSFFGMDEKTMTERVIRTFKNPFVNIFFHPTGRVVGKRDAYHLDFPKILRAAKQYNIALEVNSSDRMDLNDIHIREAIAAGVKLVIDSDAHHPGDFSLLRYGIAQARRGWATEKDVLNTLPWQKLLEVLKKKR